MKMQNLFILNGNANVADTIRGQAIQLGFEVKVFDDLNLFIDACATCHPSHLIIDLLMSALDGGEILSRLGRQHCQSSIIFSNVGPTLSAAQLSASENQLKVAGVLHSPIEAQALSKLLSGADMAGKQFIADASSIAQALQHNQFVWYYQPQIDLPSGKVTCLKGLLQWNHPAFGIQPAAAFMPVIEKTGQRHQLMHHMISSAFDFLQTLTPDLSFALTMPVAHIHDPNIAGILHRACQTWHIAPQRVVLVLASAGNPVDHLAQIEIPLQQLNKLGFRLRIEGSDADMLSPARLAELPFSELSIDKSLVTSMAHSANARKTIASSLKMARKLTLSTVAEGVENDMAAIGLRELGCQSGLGHYFADPMDCAATRLWLRRWNQQLAVAANPRPASEKMNADA